MRKVLVFILCANVSLYLGFSLQAPFLPAELHRKNVDPNLNGIVFA